MAAKPVVLRTETFGFMITKKDFDSAENRDLPEKSGELENQGVKDNPVDEVESAAGKTEVKNAHATGDGAYGRSDKSVADGNKKEGSPNEPPY